MTTSNRHQGGLQCRELKGSLVSALSVLGVLVLLLFWPAVAQALTQEILVAPIGEDAGDRFGIAVASAGDINGDGYDDFIVGAPFYDTYDYGCVYIYLGGQFVDLEASKRLLGGSSYDYKGRSVSSAGDVNGDGYADFLVGRNTAGGTTLYFGHHNLDNLDLLFIDSGGDLGGTFAAAGDINGDGYDDFIIGMPHDDDAGTNAGKIYVFLGGPNLDEIADLTITGEAAGDCFGSSVSGAGDINADGYDDLIVGAPYFDSNDRGRAYVFFGGATLDTDSDLVFVGGVDGFDELGGSVAGVGDVNGDGYDDVTVGATCGNTYYGYANIYYGGPDADANPDLVLNGDQSLADEFACSVASAGDVNGDGFSDIIVGARNSGAIESERGRAYVYFGGTDIDAVSDILLIGDAAGDHFGTSVASAGDIDGDGRSDIIIGAPDNGDAGYFAGKAVVYSFSPYELLTPGDGERWYIGTTATVRWQGTERADLDYSTDAGATWTTLAIGVGGQETNHISFPVPATPTEYAKVRLSYTAQTPSLGTSATSAGVFCIVEPGLPSDVVHQLLIASIGNNAWEGMETVVSSAGDFNGDGYDDVLSGAPSNSGGGNDAGQVSVYFGGPHADEIPDLVIDGEAADDRFGRSVSPAGDVNGDGFGDFIVGADQNDEGGVNAGKVYLYFGSHYGSIQAGLTIIGEADWDQFGHSVSAAGDVNGDGYCDFIVGAAGNDQGESNAGRVYVYYGGSVVDATADLVLTGEEENDYFGLSVGTVGDFNGDGYCDFIVRSNNGVTGSAYVYFGGIDADTDVDLVLEGNGTGNYFSYSSAGDVNGDGYDDLVIGETREAGGVDDFGLVRVFLGGPDPDAVTSITLTGEADDDYFGCCVTSLGDINGDQFDDFGVGARFSSHQAGKTYIYFGGPFLDSVADHTILGENMGDQFGYSLAGAGDVDGDGKSDLIVSAPNNDQGGNAAGKIYVFSLSPYQILSPGPAETWVAGTSVTVRWKGQAYADLDYSTDGGATWISLLSGIGGSPSNLVTINVPATATDFAKIRLTRTGLPASLANTVTSTGLFRIVLPEATQLVPARLQATHSGATEYDSFGCAVTPAGDFNGDGYADYLVGAYAADVGEDHPGVAYLYCGGPTADGVADFTFTGEATGDKFGVSTAAAGDFNGDGFDDVIIGAYFNGSGADHAGRAYVFCGGPGADEIADYIFTGEDTWNLFGVSVGGAGDVNGDGYADVVVGASYNNAGGAAAGRAYIFFGGLSADTVADVTFTGAADDDRLGVSVGGAGDVNGDGFDDVIVGANHSDVGGSNAGQAFVYFGGPGLDTVADLSLTGAAAGDDFGQAVATAGDFNGDGYADVVVGANYNDAGGYLAGRAYVYFGGPAPDAVADLILTGECLEGEFGKSVACAGDVNGDGYFDLIIGEYGNDVGGEHAGCAYLFLGGTSADTMADYVFTGETAGDRLGWAVAGAGDINGDGFDDVLCGSILSDTGGSDSGSAHLYDFNRYFLTTPNGAETWNVGATETVRWQGKDLADLWLSVDGGASYDLLDGGVGGNLTNSLPLIVPHVPTRFALVKISPTDPTIPGHDVSDTLFTIDASVILVSLKVEAAVQDDGGVVISWQTDPGPEDLSGYRLEKAEPAVAATDGPDTWFTLVAETTETFYVDATAVFGDRFRLSAVNGLGEEFILGETSFGMLARLVAWPLPYRGGELNISFATAGGLGGGAGRAEVRIYNLAGRLITTLVQEDLPAGYRSTIWNGRDSAGRAVSSGVYFLRLVSGGYSETRKLVVIR